MNTARLSRYAVIARLRCSGSSFIARAICGSAVAMIVESRFSMNTAQAMINGTTRVRPRLGSLIDTTCFGVRSRTSARRMIRVHGRGLKNEGIDGNRTVYHQHTRQRSEERRVGK